MRALWRHWESFWFEAAGERNFRVFRSALGWLLLFFYLLRSLDLGLFFSESGILRSSILPDVFKLDYRYSLLTLFPGDAALWVLNTLFLLSLLVLALGWATRLSAGVALALHVSFIHRNPAGAYGVDLIAVFFLAYLAIGGSRAGTLNSMAYRLSQIQVCVIYGYSGLQKLKGLSWWRGEALWQVLANHQMTRWDFSWMAAFPTAILIATYLTVLFEIYFPALIWVRQARPVVLFFGVFLHLGIGIAIGIPFFGALMLVTYTLFMTDPELEQLQRAVKKLTQIRKVTVRGADRFIV